MYYEEVTIYQRSHQDYMSGLFHRFYRAGSYFVMTLLKYVPTTNHIDTLIKTCSSGLFSRSEMILVGNLLLLFHSPFRLARTLK